MAEFELAVTDYEQSLQRFVIDHDLPAEWFAVPDHLAIKYYDATEFEAGLRFWKPKSKEITYIEMDGRRLATAHLGGAISVGAFGEVEWLELMEPRPEKVGKDVVGLEHMEFYFPNFRAVRAVLGSKGVDYELQQNPSHSWVNLVINSQGQEVKINDNPLAKIISKEIEEHKAIFYK